MEAAKETESMREASKELSLQFKSLVDSDDINSLNQLQHLILGRLQDSNAVLSHFNDFSEHCYSEISPDFATHTRLFKSMKSDLDHIFLKLRSMKAKVMDIYPDAFPDESAEDVFDRRLVSSCHD